jgi:YggT family protein
VAGVAILQFLDFAIRAYEFLIIIWSFGSWFPQWRYQRWFQTVKELVYPYLNLFSRLNLRVGMYDLTPLVAIVILELFRYILRASAVVRMY